MGSQQRLVPAARARWFDGRRRRAFAHVPSRHDQDDGASEGSPHLVARAARRRDGHPLRRRVAALGDARRRAAVARRAHHVHRMCSGARTLLHDLRVGKTRVHAHAQLAHGWRGLLRTQRRFGLGCRRRGGRWCGGRAGDDGARRDHDADGRVQAAAAARTPRQQRVRVCLRHYAQGGRARFLAVVPDHPADESPVRARHGRYQRGAAPTAAPVWRPLPCLVLDGGRRGRCVGCGGDEPARRGQDTLADAAVRHRRCV
mmetsp:Transcript_978/g.2238  ORF Transcript_978/g.2238 Transcript_978/m.2238 type:complete len:258 (+) Transcript_978:260-1033(+)